MVELSIAAGSTLHALQEERGATVAALEAAIPGAARTLGAVRTAADVATDELLRCLTRHRAILPPRALRHAERALELLDGRATLRARAVPGRVDDLVHGLTHAADDLLGFLGTLEVLASSTRAATAVTAYAALVRAKESAMLEQARLTNALGADALEPTEVRTLEALVKAEHLHLETFTATASPEVRTAFWDLAAGPTFTTVARIEHDLLAGAARGPLIEPATWFALASAKLQRLHDLERLQSDGLRAAAGSATHGH
jgi:hypothetical protein